MSFKSLYVVWLVFILFSSALLPIYEYKAGNVNIRKKIGTDIPVSDLIFYKNSKGVEDTMEFNLFLLMLTGCSALLLCSPRDENMLHYNGQTTDANTSSKQDLTVLSDLCFSFGNLFKPCKLDKANSFDYLSELKRFRDIPFHQQQYSVFPSSLERYFNDVVPQRTSTSVQMRHEWARYESLKDFPQSSPVHPMRLAQNGFYYSGNNDEVICFSCNIKVRDWKDDDIPSLVHRRFSPDCRHVNGTDQSNVSIHDIPDETPMPSMVYHAHGSTNYTSGDLEMDRLNTTDTSAPDGSLHVEHHSALSFINTQRTHKHPDFEELSKRLDTFLMKWPCSEIQQPKDLAEAGFYFAGFNDCVRCFSCGGGLRNWEYGDGPWEEHARWFPQCRYLLEKKGAEFIREHEMHEHSDTDDEGEGAAGHRGQEQVISGTDALLRLKGDDKQIPKNETVENNRTTRSNNDTDHNKQETEPSSTNTSESDLIKSLLSMGFEQHCIQVVLATLKRNKTVVTVHNMVDKLTEQNDEKDKLSNEVTNIDQSKKAAHFSKATTHTEKTRSKKKEDLKDGKQIKEENEKLRQLVQCKICMDKDACIVCLPCGHIAACEECAPNLRKCAICRMLIKARVKAFMS